MTTDHGLTDEELEQVRRQFIEHIGFDPTEETDLDPELVEYLETDSERWEMLRHPLVYGVPYSPQMNGRYNAQLQAKKEACTRALENKAWHTYVFLHERPYRVGALNAIAGQMTDQEYWSLVADAWVDSENIRQNPDVWVKLLKSKRSHREYMMGEEDREALYAMPSTITVYQGHTNLRDDGWSWTTQRTTAVWFAKRFADLEHARPALTTAQVHKSDVIAYLTRRGEYEIIVNPARILMRSTTGLVV